MKTELSKIAQDLEQGNIDEDKARNLLLGLLGVRLSLPNDHEIEKKAEFRQKPRNINNTAEEEFIYGFIQGADWIKDMVLCNEV